MEVLYYTRSIRLNSKSVGVGHGIGRGTKYCNESVCLSVFIVAALRSRCGHYIFVLFLLSFFSPNLSGRRLDVYHTSTQCDLSANLECRSELYCTRLAETTGRRKSPKNRHLGTVAQVCRAVSSQLRQVSTTGKTC